MTLFGALLLHVALLSRVLFTKQSTDSDSDVRVELMAKQEPINRKFLSSRAPTVPQESSSQTSQRAPSRVLGQEATSDSTPLSQPHLVPPNSSISTAQSGNAAFAGATASRRFNASDPLRVQAFMREHAVPDEDLQQCETAQRQSPKLEDAISEPVVVAVMTNHFFGSEYTRDVTPCSYNGCPIECK